MMEIRPSGPLRAAVAVPGSKSYTQRALVAAALADGRSVLRGPLVAEDTTLLADALRRLGAEIDILPGGDLAVTGTGGRLAAPGGEIRLGNNGTATRLLLSVVALGAGDYTLTGDARLLQRPVRPVLDALTALGGAWSCAGREGYLPVVVHARGLTGGRAEFGDLDSSQYVSSILLAAPCARGDVEVVLAGSLVSAPYIGMTVEVMRAFGATVDDGDGSRYAVPGGQGYRATDFAVEGDASSASYVFLAAALAGGEATVTNLVLPSRQGDAALLDILRDLGCTVTSGAHGTTVSRHGPLADGDRAYDLADLPDMVPTLAVLAAARPGRTTIRGVAHLRIKESDRLAAVVTELGRTGIAAAETADGLVITGGQPRGATIETYHDHRIAMSFAILGLVAPGMRIVDPGCVRKSYPGFWTTLAQLTAPPNVVLLGYRGSGKSEVGRRLAQHLGRPFIDTDALIREQTGRTARELVAAGGWEAFRAAERTAIAGLGEVTGSVIALGGGAVLDARNVAALRPRATFVWLDADAAVLAARLAADPQTREGRPALGGVDPRAEVAAVLQERRPSYAATADVTVDTTTLTIDEVVARLIEVCGSR